MDEREQGVHECRAGEHAMRDPEDGSEPRSAPRDRSEEGVVDEREREPGQEVQQVPERLGTGPVAGKSGAEQEWELHPCEVDLVPASQRGGEDQRADEAARDSAPDAHVAIAAATASAALINARWERPCGRFPRKAPVAGSISSAYSPTSLASPTS
jgi:hypothetical protein